MELRGHFYFLNTNKWTLFSGFLYGVSGNTAPGQWRNAACLRKYDTHLTSICPGVHAVCLHTGVTAAEIPPHSWRTGLFLWAPGRFCLHAGVCTGVQSTAATSEHFPCSTLSGLRRKKATKTMRKLPAVPAVNHLGHSNSGSEVGNKSRVQFRQLNSLCAESALSSENHVSQNLMIFDNCWVFSFNNRWFTDCCVVQLLDPPTAQLHHSFKL